MATHAGDTYLIQLGNMLFNIGVPASGIMWVGSLTGWDSTPPRPLAIGGELVDGDHWQPGFYGARQLTLQGYGTLYGAGGDIGALRAARERLVAATQIVGTLARLRVTELIGVTSVAREVDVYTTDRPEVIIQGCTIRFAVGLSAPDARKYSQTVGTSTLVGTLPYDAGVTTVAATATTITLPVPAGSTTGDVLEAFIEVAGNVTVVPAGWSNVLGQSYVAGRTQYLYRRVAGGAEPANYVWTFAGSYAHTGVMIRVANSDTAQVGVTAMNGDPTATYLAWPEHTPAPRSLRLFGGAWPGASVPGSPPSPLIFRANPITGGSASYLAVSPRATGATDPGPIIVNLTPYVANGRIAINPPPLVAPTMLSIGGTAAVPPILTVAGPTNRYIVICNGDQCVRFDVGVGLVAGDVLVADFGTRRVTVNGINRYDYTWPGSSWWVLGPGINYISPFVGDVEFDTDMTTLWQFVTGSGGLAQTKQVSNNGTGSLEIVIGTAGTNRVRSTSRPGVVVGTTYAASAVMRPRSTVRNVAIEIAWLNSVGGTISTTAGTTTAEGAAPAWTILSVSGAAPAGAISAAVQLRIDSAAVGEAHYADQMGMYLTALPADYDERAANVIDYSGGGTAVLSWTEADW